MKNLGISPEDPLGVTVTRLRVESVKFKAFLNYLNASYVCVLRRGFALFVCLYCVLCVCAWTNIVCALCLCGYMCLVLCLCLCGYMFGVCVCAAK